jgi:hypothetical protein
MLDVCWAYGVAHNIIFNHKKTVSAVAGHVRSRTLAHVCINNEPIPWVDALKYLGVTFNVRDGLQVDVSYVKRKFYSALNSVLARCAGAAEPVKIQLLRSFCLPLLMYCIGAFELSNTAVTELSVCWNDAFRKIFHYNRWESVKQVQYYFGCLDLKHMYHLARFKFMSTICVKIPYLCSFYVSLELHYHSSGLLNQYYVGDSSLSFVAAVHKHFYSSLGLL